MLPDPEYKVRIIHTLIHIDPWQKINKLYVCTFYRNNWRAHLSCTTVAYQRCWKHPMIRTHWAIASSTWAFSYSRTRAWRWKWSKNWICSMSWSSVWKRWCRRIWCQTHCTMRPEITIKSSIAPRMSWRSIAIGHWCRTSTTYCHTNRWRWYFCATIIWSICGFNFCQCCKGWMWISAKPERISSTSQAHTMQHSRVNWKQVPIQCGLLYRIWRMLHTLNWHRKWWHSALIIWKIGSRPSTCINRNMKR